MPSVRFAESVDDKKDPPRKRPRVTNEDFPDNDPQEDEQQKQKKYRPNEDEIDDIDEWNEDEDPDDNAGVPSEKMLLEAKRKRRQISAGLDADGKTNIDNRTSLAAEGISIEPFHMKNEESDGTGFFDGDTYVFRKYNAEEGEDDEPDAWLDRLREDAAEGRETEYKIPEAAVAKQNEAQSSMDDLSKEELYSKILPLLNDNETVSQAMIRYGKLIKQSKGPPKGTPKTESSSQSTAKTYLEKLTGAANTLLLRGEVTIYQDTKTEVQRRIPPTQFCSATKQLVEKQAPTKWEYRGNQDDALHGPYTTEQMIAWTKAGYFVGAQRVQIRTIRQEKKELSVQDDLLNDLMDDEADESDTVQETKGEWQWSNEVDFDAYLP